ncbi:MAG: hypothetical protein QXV62_05930, partial [Nitrososphaerota archaeon]
GRGIDECIRFLEVVRDRCANNPTVYMDRAPWYGEACLRLGLEHRRYRLGEWLFQAMERAVHMLKDRTISHAGRGNVF